MDDVIENLEVALYVAELGRYFYGPCFSHIRFTVKW